MRVSAKEALERGWITPDQVAGIKPAKGQDRATRVQKRRARDDNDLPQRLLYEGLKKAIPEVVAEYGGAVPGRKFRLDCAIPAIRLGIELDGWEWHGRHLNDFKRDRERDRLLTLEGWRLLRFTASEVMGDLDACVRQVLVLYGLLMAERPGALSSGHDRSL